MAWCLIKKTFDWTETNSLYELIRNSTPDTILSEMLLSWKRLLPKLTSKLPPVLTDGRLGLATAYQKYGKPEPKKRPVIDLKFDPTINIRKAAARAGIFCLNNILQQGSFHLSNSAKLREKLDKIVLYFKTLSAPLHLTNPVLITMSDDIEGFFTNVNVDAAIEAHERIICLYQIQFANKKRQGKRRFQPTARNSKKVFVPLAKTVKPIPGYQDTSKIPGKYSTVQLKDLTPIIKWTAQYRTFTLGKLILRQKDGLFQGCPLSVYLALAIAFVSEHDASLTTIGRSIRGCRYVDDKMNFTISENNAPSILLAKDNLKLFNSTYHPSLTVKEEQAVSTLAGVTKYVYIGHILTNTGTEIKREYYNKNWHHYKQGEPFKQVYKLEQHYGSYCSITALRGQRIGRLLTILRSSDPDRQLQVLCEKLYEYTYGLQDPIPFTISLLRLLLRIYANQPHEGSIIAEAINAYKKVLASHPAGEKDIFSFIPSLTTGSILHC
jgi:hypothetical protein